MPTVTHRKPNRRQHAIPRVSPVLDMQPCTRPECEQFHRVTAAQLVAEGFDPAELAVSAKLAGPDWGGPGLLRIGMIMRDLLAAGQR